MTRAKTKNKKNISRGISYRKTVAQIHQIHRAEQESIDRLLILSIELKLHKHYVPEEPLLNFS